MRKIYLIILITSLFNNFYGQITTSINPSLAQMQALLQGNGVVVSGLTITCPAGAYATFANGASTLGGTLNSGILLTTGSASLVSGPNPNTTSNNLSYDALAPGSALGNTLANSGINGTFDGCYINFLLTPSCATLSINYVFASEEYPEYAAGTINDVFGFVLSGQNPAGGNYNQTNISTLPGTSTPVSIQNVNNGSANAGPCVNCTYYVPSPPGLEYDGKTTVLTASASVVPCQTYTMTIGVWDDSDGILDSGVFLDVNGLSCANQPSLVATVNPTTTCGPQTVTLSVNGGFATGSYTWSAPASGGLAATTGSVVTANPTAATTYTVKYSDINTCPGFPVTTTVSIGFTTPPALPVSQNPAGSICTGQSATLTANGGAGTYSWSPGTGLSTTTNSVTVCTPTITTTYTVTKSVGSCISSTVITVTVGGSSVAITPSVSSICAGQSQVLTASGPGPFNWISSSGAFPPAIGTVTVTPGISTSYTVISGTGSCTSSAVASVSISAPPAVSITPSLSIICSGQSQVLSVSGAGPFNWISSSGAFPPAIGTVTVTPAISTSYTVISGAGSCTTSAVAGVSVTSTSSVAITPSLSTICLGQSQVLSASGPGPFNWISSSGALPPAIATVTVSPNTLTTYTVISGVGSCTNSAIATVSISLTPSIAITPSLSTICLGQSQALSSSGAGPFNWSASSGATPPAAANVTVTPTTTTTYTVLSGSGSCTASAVATVSLSIPIATTVTPAQSSICSGQSQTLTASGTGPFAWIASNGPNPISAAVVVVTPTITTTYTVIEGSGVCTSSAVATVTIGTIPSITITPTNTTICNGQSTLLTVIGSAGPFTWTASSGANPPSAAVVNVTPTLTTTYTVLSGIGTCTALAVANISVSPAITVSITPSNTTICNGSSASLSASGATSYTWFPSLSNSVTQVVSPTSTSIYSVVGTNGVCVNAATATVNVTSVATSVNSSSPFYCIGASPVNLTANGATTYSWSPVTNLNSSIGAVVTATPAASIVYSVTGTTGNCSSTQTIAISVPPQTAITSTTSNSIICVGVITPTLNAFGASTYTWLPFSTSSSSLTVNPTITTSYTVLGQTSAGCLTLPSIVTVSVLPTINPTLSTSSSTLCLTKTVSIIASPASSGLTYSWQPASAILGASNTSSIIAKPTSTSVVIYTVTISNGLCIGTNTIQLQAFIAPEANFITLNNDTICVGGCVTFSSTSTGSLPMTYSWLYEGGVGTSSVGATPEACYPSAGNFSVTLITTNGCSSDTMVKSNFINVYDMPIIIAYGDTTLNIGESTEIFVTGGLSYYWYPNNSSIACITCSNTTVQPTVSTNYIVVGSNSQYCQAQDTVKIIVDFNCGDFFIPNVFSPNDDGLNDFINVHGRCITAYNLQIFSRWGEKVFETSNLENSWDGTYKGKKMDTGVFVYKADGVSIDGKSFKFKGNITLIR